MANLLFDFGDGSEAIVKRAPDTKHPLGPLAKLYVCGHGGHSDTVAVAATVEELRGFARALLDWCNGIAGQLTTPPAGGST